MRLLRLEMKRVLKTRTTMILLVSALLLSFIMAWLPTTFSHITYTDDRGNEVSLKGLASINYEKELQADIAGVVTTDKMRQALEGYQSCLSKYGAESSYELPDGVYQKEILPFDPLLHGMREVFADPNTGIAPSLMEITPDKIGNFYEKCTERNISLMKQEQEKFPAAQETARKMYEKVEKPFLFFPGYSSDPMDYQLLLAFLILVLCTVIAAPVFTSDYQTGADDILRCTKYGRARLAAAKIISCLLICGGTFSICAFIYIVVSNSLFGWEITKTSMQMIYSAVNLSGMNIGQLQCFFAFGSLLCAMATMSFTLFLSSRFNNVVVTLSIAMVFCMLPIIVYMAFPSGIGKWIYPVLPAGGVGLQASFLYAAIDFEFWNVGQIAVWLPYVMLGAYVIEIPLFVLLTVWSYINHNNAKN